MKNDIHILLISVHGLIRGHDLELGRDADTGGQTKYVVELARSLARQPQIASVDLVTRLIRDPQVSADYAQPIEDLGDGARIVRIECGAEGYIPKEQLWDCLDNFTDNLVDWLNGQPQRPDLVHGHYADAGYVGVRISHQFAIPLVQTGHSLGRDKRKQLLAKGLSAEKIEVTYNMLQRIDAEENALANADLVITSTRNEIDEQYGLYNYYDPQRMAVIPPGVDLEQFRPAHDGETFEFATTVDRFLDAPGKPLILALSRPDERKNILTLLEAYGESPALQDAANLLIVAGNRDDIRDMDQGARSVLTNILLLVDAYDLYGRVAVPKTHRPEQVPEIYRLAASRRGVFINPALTEPFGLTLLEASASGLPIVATENGGPVDIIENCANGRLVDPLDKGEITEALLAFLRAPATWSTAVHNGLARVAEHYTWAAHAQSYIAHVEPLLEAASPLPEERPAPRALRYRDRALFSDLDQNLVGNSQALAEFSRVMRENRKCVTFGIATGRRLDTALAVIRKHNIPAPDVLITSLGTRIHYGKGLTEDALWTEHIERDWSPDRIRRILAQVPGLKLQPKKEQADFKVSYYYDAEQSWPVEDIIDLLRKEEITANLQHSFGQFIDIVPSRASKGQALRFVAQRLEIPLEHVLVAGGSGADEDMMRGNTLAVVVANRHDEELSQLEDHERIYFAHRAHAAGILEAAAHYGFFAACSAEARP